MENTGGGVLGGGLDDIAFVRWLMKASSHWYRTGLLSRSKTNCSSGWRARTKGSGLKVPPLVPALRLGTKWGHLVPIGNTNRDYRGAPGSDMAPPLATPFSPGWYYQPGLKVFVLFLFPFHFFIDFGFQLYMFSNLIVYTAIIRIRCTYTRVIIAHK